MKIDEQSCLDFLIPFFPWGILFMMWTFFWGLFGLVTESYLRGVVQIVVFMILGFVYGWDYCRIKKLLLKYAMEKIKKKEVMNDTEDTVLESFSDEKTLKSVDVKFDLSSLGNKNTFLLIKIPSSFIDEFKKYNSSLNSLSILGKKIYEWGDRDNGMCTQNVLCFSKVQIKSTIEQVSNEVHAAIEWLPNKNGDRSKCTQKWVKFEWK